MSFSKMANSNLSYISLFIVIFPSLGKIISKIKPGLLLGDMNYFIDFCKELVEERKKEKNTHVRSLIIFYFVVMSCINNKKK